VVPGPDLPGLDIVATAASYGIDAHEAHDSDEVTKLVEAAVADRDRPTLINARTTPVSD
jgi:benzoylformate decarboxylase